MNRLLFLVAIPFIFMANAGFGITGRFQPVSEAAQDNYDIKFYHLNLNISDSSTYLAGSASIIFTATVPMLEQVWFDCSDLLQVDSVTATGTALQFSHAGNKLFVDLNNPLDEGNQLMVTIYYHGLGRNSGVSSGVYSQQVSAWNTRITYTLTEPFSALNFFPCKQVLTDKADSVYMFLSTDANLKAGSNGLLTAEVPLPGNRVRYEWKSRIPIAYYLISYSVGNYLDYSFYVPLNNGTDSVLVQNYIYNDSSYLKQNQASIDKTGDMIRLYSDLYGDYPFKSEKYGHCTAPFGGGMEHQTMTTIVNFSFLLVAHELAHQWFGDYVTCSTWQDIWINEGFASYSEYLSSQYLKSQDAADSWMKGCHNYVKSASAGSVYVPEDDADDEDRIFDYRLSYKKGAALVHMIRQEIGNDSLFFATLTGFLQRYNNGTASGTDFRLYLEEKTGIAFETFFNQWYFGQGYPICHIDWHHASDTLYISSLQTTSYGTTPFNMLIEFGVNVNGSDTLITLRQTQGLANWKVYLPGQVSAVTVDPRHWSVMEVQGITNTQPDPEVKNLRIVPNPARHKVTVYFENPNGKCSLVIADASGKILSIKETSETQEVIDIGKFPTGLYMVLVQDKHNIRRGKFVIQ